MLSLPIWILATEQVLNGVSSLHGVCDTTQWPYNQF